LPVSFSVQITYRIVSDLYVTLYSLFTYKPYKEAGSKYCCCCYCIQALR